MSLKKLIILCLASMFTAFISAQDIHKYLKDNNLEEVIRIININPSFIDKQDETGNTPLHLAADDSKTEILKFLLDKGANTEIKNNDGITPIFSAVKQNHIEAVKLLSQKADLNTMNMQFITPLMFAIQFGNPPLVNVLINSGANVNFESPYGYPVHFSVLTMQHKMLALLIENGADIEVKFRELTPLHLAVLRSDFNCSKILIEKGANVEALTPDGNSALTLAITNGQGEYEKIIELLLEKGAKIKNGTNTPTELMALEKGNLKVLKQIIRKGADYNIKVTDSKMSLLQMASIYGYSEIVKYILERNIEIDYKNLNGKTALYYSKKYGNNEVSEVLLKAGAKGIEKIEKQLKNENLPEVVKLGEANIWQLKNRGWVIKTNGKLLVFDNEELGRMPDKPALSNGYINADEIAKQNIIAFYTCYHAMPNSMEFIHAIEESCKNITYVHRKRDEWRGGNNSIYLDGQEEINFNNTMVLTVEKDTTAFAIGYLVETDDLAIFYSGFYPENIENFQKEIDFISTKNNNLDIAFIDLQTSSGENQLKYIKYIVKKLNPKSIVLHHVGRHENVDKEFLRKLENQFKDLKVYSSQFPGDRFQYAK